MSVCVSYSLPNGEYPKLLIVADFSSMSFSGKTSSPVKNLYLSSFPDYNTEILAVCLSK